MLSIPREYLPLGSDGCVAHTHLDLQVVVAYQHGMWLQQTRFTRTDLRREVYMTNSWYHALSFDYHIASEIAQLI